MRRESRRPDGDDEPTAQISIGSGPPSQPVSTSEEVVPNSGRYIVSLVRYEVIMLQLCGRRQPYRFIVLSEGDITKLRLALVYPTAQYSSGPMREVVSHCGNESLSFIPQLTERFSREYVQRSSDFSAHTPSLVMLSLDLRDLEASLPISWVNIKDLPIVLEHNRVFSILAKREVFWKEGRKKAAPNR
jgi:hypothetical protein